MYDRYRYDYKIEFLDGTIKFSYGNIESFDMNKTKKERDDKAIWGMYERFSDELKGAKIKIIDIYYLGKVES